MISYAGIPLNCPAYVPGEKREEYFTRLINVIKRGEAEKGRPLTEKEFLDRLGGLNAAFKRGLVGNRKWTGMMLRRKSRVSLFRRLANEGQQKRAYFQELAKLSHASRRTGIPQGVHERWRKRESPVSGI